jgi:hypothetical protein
MPPDDGQESPFCLRPMWIRLILKLKAESSKLKAQGSKVKDEN